jgi:hypothetical protein
LIQKDILELRETQFEHITRDVTRLIFLGLPILASPTILGLKEQVAFLDNCMAMVHGQLFGSEEVQVFD